MDTQAFNVLFLCTGNSARSIIAEAMLNLLGRGRFKAFSAGSFPAGHVNPRVMAFLEETGIPAVGARSKSWDEFARPDAVRMDFVITVCDQAAGEVCPVWPGQPISAHWGVEDPAHYSNDLEHERKVIRDVARILRNRILIFVDLPLAKLDRISLQSRVREIGKDS